MHVSATLANTRVNPAFQLLFRLLRQSTHGPFAGSNLPFDAPATASFLPFPSCPRSAEPPRGARAGARTNRQKEAPVYRGRVTFMLAEPSSLSVDLAAGPKRGLWRASAVLRPRATFRC